MNRDDEINDQQRAAILRFAPHLVAADMTMLAAGWDCLAVNAGGEWLFKFPRHAEAEARLRREAALLAIIRPRVRLPAPDMILHDGPPLFSTHPVLRGAHLLSADYQRLGEAASDLLAETLAEFYADVHAIDPALLRQAGAADLAPWPGSSALLEAALPILDGRAAEFARKVARLRDGLGLDPLGITYGHFDTHGWNMAFDHKTGRLNGVYDFADSGFGPLHQDFIYLNFIARDLTQRVVSRYCDVTGKQLDFRRIDQLTLVHRLVELAEDASIPEKMPQTLANFEAWMNEAGQYF